MSEGDLDSVSSGQNSLNEQENHILPNLNLDLLQLQADGDSDARPAYPLSLSDFDLMSSTSHGDTHLLLEQLLTNQGQDSHADWVIDRFLQDTDRMDSIRLGVHQHQDIKSHSHSLMAELDVILDIIKVS